MTRAASSPKQTATESRCLALVDCFAKATWVALVFALVCLSIDGYAIFALPHHSTSPGGTHGMTVFAVSLWTLEIVLALLAVWLIRFAFSQPARLPQLP